MQTSCKETAVTLHIPEGDCTALEGGRDHGPLPPWLLRLLSRHIEGMGAGRRTLSLLERSIKFISDACQSRAERSGTPLPFAVKARCWKRKQRGPRILFHVLEARKTCFLRQNTVPSFGIPREFTALTKSEEGWMLSDFGGLCLGSFQNLPCYLAQWGAPAGRGPLFPSHPEGTGSLCLRSPTTPDTPKNFPSEIRSCQNTPAELVKIL